MTPEQYALKLSRLERELLSPEAARELLTELGVAAKDDVKVGIAPDLGGDDKMSNWPRRAKPVSLGARFTIDLPTRMTVKPDSRSVGAIAMLQNGRRVRKAGQFASRGTRTNKAGATYTRLRRVSRGVGPMASKQTWSDAERVAVREFPPRVQRFKNRRMVRAMGG